MTIDLSRLPVALLLIRRDGEIAGATPALRALLSLEDVRSETLVARFEIWGPRGEPRSGESLPWNQAARGDSFEEREIWYDRQSRKRLQIYARASSQDDVAFLALEEVSRHPLVYTLAEVPGALASALIQAETPAAAAQVAVEQLARVLVAEVAIVAGVEPETRRLVLLGSIGVPHSIVEEELPIPRDAPDLLAAAARTLEIQQRELLDEPPREERGLVARLFQLGMRSLVAVPLQARGELMGVIGIAWRHPGGLTLLERQLLLGAAQACACALQHTRTRKAERIEAERLQALRDAALALESGVPLHDLLRRLVEQACEFTRARYGALGVLNKERTELVDFVYVGVSDEIAKRIGHLPTGKGLLGAVISESRPIRVADLGRDPRSSGFPANHPRMTSFLGVPLRIGSEVFGNFYLADKDGGAEFTEEDERFMELFSAQAALAVGYARQMGLVERLREEFAAIVAHDLRNPIQALQMETDNFLRKAQGETATVPRSSLERMRRSFQRLTQMVEDLLDASRVEVKRLALDRARLSLPEVASELIGQIQPTLGNHAVELQIEGDPQTVMADRVRVHQIITNLLTNAAKYSPEGTPIQVTIRPTEGGTVVSVQDRGFGIPPEEMSRLFDRFYQAKRARAMKTGLGLGLYITKGLVDAHGGHIWVESKVGAGSTFYVWLPRAEEAPAEEPAAPPAPV